MEYRPLGRCGTKVSVFGLGGWTTYGASVTEFHRIKKIIHAAFDVGVNFFDISDAYEKGEAERVMGRVLRDFPRHRLVITSKLFWPISEDVNDRGLSRKHIMESIEKSLRNIGTDYLDIYFCHRFDAETPSEETARAMDDLVHQGKILYWGTSEWTGKQLADAHKICSRLNLYRPQVEQPQYNLLARKKFERDVRPVAVRNGMGLVTWSPLASGMLTGKYDDGIPKGTRLERIEWLRKELVTPKNMSRVKKFKEVADSLGCTRAQLALAWLVAQPAISSVITGATRVEQLQENLGALTLNLKPTTIKSVASLFEAYS